MLESGSDVAIVDLRRALEVQHDQVKLPGAIWIDLGDLEAREGEIPREKDVILYCS
jgi:rhodanese-related sulfurtransferase